MGEQAKGGPGVVVCANYFRGEAARQEAGMCMRTGWWMRGRGGSSARLHTPPLTTLTVER
mgnify:CR=1 FL=1